MLKSRVYDDDVFQHYFPIILDEPFCPFHPKAIMMQAVALNAWTQVCRKTYYSKRKLQQLSTDSNETLVLVRV